VSACDIDLYLIYNSRTDEETLNCEVEKRSFDVAAYVSAENLETLSTCIFEIIFRTSGIGQSDGSALKRKLLIV